MFERSTTTGGGPHLIQRPVLAWDDDGMPLVAPEPHEGRRTLQRADGYPGYKGIGEDGDQLLALIPGGGWVIDASGEDNGERWTRTDPVVAWGLYCDNSVRPLDTDDVGHVDEAVIDSTSGGRLRHPATEATVQPIGDSPPGGDGTSQD